MTENGRKPGPRGALQEDLLRNLVDVGATVREIAAEVDRSPTTVRYWLKRYAIQLPRRGTQRIHGVAGDSRRRIRSRCRKHGETEFALQTNGYYRCMRCMTEAVQRWRWRTRRLLVEEAGGVCVSCGFDKPAALEFHHLEPGRKSFGLAARGITRAVEVLREEASKCVLLCSNCHARVEAGELRLPEEIVAAKLGSGAGS